MPDLDSFDIRDQSTLSTEEQDIDRALRPLSFDTFRGQDKAVENLKIFVQAAKMRSDALDHVLLYGPPGLGKTTLSHIIAAELGVGIKITSGPVLDKPGDLAGLLTSLEPNDVLFIDEIHRLSPIVEEYLYSAMEDYRIDIMLDKGPSARSSHSSTHFTPHHIHSLMPDLDSFDIRDQSTLSTEEQDIDRALRPLSFDTFRGQDKAVENLKIFVQAAKMRSDALDHVLLYGPPGLGKTTLSHIIAAELGVGIKITSGPVLDKPGDLAGLLTSLEPNDVLFIDEIHRLSPIVEEYLYSAMEDYRIDIMLDKGPSARSIQIDLNPFTLVGATTRSGLLTAPLRARFGINLHLEYYDIETLADIVHRSADILQTPCVPSAAVEVASRSRGTPRIANALLRRVRDFAQVKGDGRITKEIACYALEALNIDRYGLDYIDNKLLGVIIDKFAGGPVGLTTIATALGEDPGTVEEVYEPYLIKEGFIKRTPRGREATDLAYSHLGRKPRIRQAGSFFDDDNY